MEKAKAYIHQNENPDEVFFEIRVDCGYGEKDPAIVRCWDFILTEHLCKAVNEYMNSEYKIISR